MHFRKQNGGSEAHPLKNSLPRRYFPPRNRPHKRATFVQKPPTTQPSSTIVASSIYYIGKADRWLFERFCSIVHKRRNLNNYYLIAMTITYTLILPVARLVSNIIRFTLLIVRRYTKGFSTLWLKYEAVGFLNCILASFSTNSFHCFCVKRKVGALHAYKAVSNCIPRDLWYHTSIRYDNSPLSALSLTGQLKTSKPQ